MADVKSIQSNSSATGRLRNPDDLDKYIRVTNSGVWIALIACVAALLVLFAWSLLGTVATNVTTTGVCMDGSVVCFLSADDAATVHEGDEAMVGQEHMTVTRLSDAPLSREEAKEFVDSDYLLNAVLTEDWAYLVLVEGDGDYDFSSGTLHDVTITTERVSPISLIVGNGVSR